MQEENTSWDRLRVFSLLWGLAIIIHTSAFPFNIVSTPLSWFMILIAALLVLNSASIPLLMGLSLIQLIEFAMRAPLVPNHWLLSSLMSLNILICIGFALFRQKNKAAIDREALFDALAVAGRLLVIVVFWAATFHKLNTDFLNPLVSCAVSLYERIAEIYHLPQNEMISWLAIYGTFLIEFFLPILLIVPRSRNWGIVVGMLFHLFLGMRDIYDFGAILYALYFLFVSKHFLEAFAKAHAGLLQRVRGLGWLAKLSVFLLLLIPMRWVYGLRLGAEYFAPLWIIAALLMIYLFIRAFAYEEAQKDSVFVHWGLARFSFGLILAICLLNSLSPYFGLKTNLAFDMYSNLRLENNISNHLLIPSGWQVFPYTRDLVEVLESDDPQLQLYISSSWFITRHELSRFIEMRPDFRTRVLYQGQEYSLPEQREVFEPISPMLLWLLIFEPIEQTEVVSCSW